MMKYYGAFLIRKIAYDQLDELKDKLRRILKHPGLGSSIPWFLIKLSFLLTGLFLGIIIYSIMSSILTTIDSQNASSAIISSLGIILLPLVILFTYSFLKKRYCRVPGDVHEMNTFLVALGEYKDRDAKHSKKILTSLDRKMTKALQKYHEEILNLAMKETKKDLDIKAFRKDYEKIINVISKNSSNLTLPKSLDAWQEDLIKWCRTSYSNLLHDNMIWIWHDTQQHEVMINLPILEQLEKESSEGMSSNHPLTLSLTNMKGNDDNILHHLDELTITTFFVHHYAVSSNMLTVLDQWLSNFTTATTTWIQAVSAHLNNSKAMTNNETDEIDIFEASIQDPLADLTLLMINKLSGSAEILLQQARQKEHMARLANSFLNNLENDDENPFLMELKKRFVNIPTILSETETCVSMLRKHSNQLIHLSMQLRGLQSTIRRLKIKGLLEHQELLDAFLSLLENFLPFYKELEKIRFLTQWFEDIEHFTILEDEIALESGSKDARIDDIPNGVILAAKNLFKQYQGAAHTVYALRGVSLQIKDGEFLIITGPSGSGKTTLLNVLSGLDLPDRGLVILDGQDITKMNQKKLADLRRDKIGFIFQFYNLLPVFNALENVSYPREIKGEIKPARKRARHLLGQVGLEKFIKQTPNKLSGGQMQRVTIARSLQNVPKIIFADEPTGDLDHVTGEQIMDLLKKFHDDGHTIILVTHDLSLLKYGTRWIEMRDGQIIKDELL